VVTSGWGVGGYSVRLSPGATVAERVWTPVRSSAASASRRRSVESGRQIASDVVLHRSSKRDRCVDLLRIPLAMAQYSQPRHAVEKSSLLPPVEGGLCSRGLPQSSSSARARKRRAYSSQLAITAAISWRENAPPISRSNSSNNASARAGDNLSPSSSISASTTRIR